MFQIQTRHEWVAELAAQSGSIAAMRLDKHIKNADLDVDAIKLAHDEAHTRVIIRAVEALLTSQASTQKNTAALLTEIIRRDAYGNFSELAAYDWLMRNNLKITTQVGLSSEDILGSRDATLDGLIDFCGIYFEIKAFGFHGHLAKRLKERLEPYFIGERVFIEASWDLSVDLFTKVIQDVPKIAVELRQNPSKQIGPLRIRIQAPQPVTITHRRVQPYLLARDNALYPFRSANQFTNKAPFILIFVMHQWFNESAISNDFSGVDSVFTRSLARRAFMQFTNDPKLLNEVCRQVNSDITLSDATKALSAIFFLNLSPEDTELGRPTLHSSIYLNPRATYPLTQVDLFRSIDPNILVDDFSDDNY